MMAQSSDSGISTNSSSFVVWAAVLGDLLVGGTKLAAALVTGSTALFSGAVQSFVDVGDELLLLWGSGLIRDSHAVGLDEDENDRFGRI